MAESWESLEDYEDWSPESGYSLKVHAIAGSLAGAAEHGIIYPFDTIRTMMQAEGSQKTRIKSVIHKEGISRLWRGVSTILPATIPAHAIYFSVFEKSKEAFGGNNDDEHTPIAAAISGVLATIGHDFIMTPMDVIKQRMQLGAHSNLYNAASSIVRNEGANALFRSLPTTLLMNMPFAGVMVAANESFKKVLNPKNEYNLPAFLISGGLAGAVAAFMTTPMDVIKTRLQTQSVLKQELLVNNNAYNNTSKHALTATDHIKRSSKKVSKFFNKNLKQGLLNSSFFNNSSGTVTLGNVAPFYSRASHCKGLLNCRTCNHLRRCTTKGLTNFTRVLSVPAATKVNKSKETGIRYHGFVDTAQTIYKKEGMYGFMKGAKPRVLVFAPSVAISWATYETAKNILVDVL